MKPCATLRLDSCSFKQPYAGFSLIELMIAVVIVSILAAVAVPNYSAYVMRGRLADAQAQLSSYRLRLEQSYQDNRNYGTPNQACTAPVPEATRFFVFACTVGNSNQEYVASATGVANTATNGFTFQVNHQGATSTSALPEGWGAVPRNCWIQSRGQAC